MLVLNKTKIRKEAKKHPQVRGLIDAFITLAERSEWVDFGEFSKHQRKASYDTPWLVVRLKSFRLIVAPIWSTESIDDKGRSAPGILHLAGLLTHDECDRNRWKSWQWPFGNESEDG